MAMLLITHDLGVVARDRRPGGGDVCRARWSRRPRPVDGSSTRPQHPYTRGLLGASPEPRRRPRPGASGAAARDPGHRAARSTPCRRAAASRRAARTCAPACRAAPAAADGASARSHVACSPARVRRGSRERPHERAAPSAHVLRADDLAKHFRHAPAAPSTRVDGVTSTSRAARRSGSSASPAAARPRSARR